MSEYYNRTPSQLSVALCTWNPRTQEAQTGNHEFKTSLMVYRVTLKWDSFKDRTNKRETEGEREGGRERGRNVVINVLFCMLILKKQMKGQLSWLAEENINVRICLMCFNQSCIFFYWSWSCALGHPPPPQSKDDVYNNHWFLQCNPFSTIGRGK